MPDSDYSYTEADSAMEGRRLGSVLLVLGWTLLWMDVLLGIYFFISLRDGSMFWPVWLAVEGLAGLVLVIVGTHYRRMVRPTRLAERATRHMLWEQRREDEEERHVV